MKRPAKLGMRALHEPGRVFDSGCPTSGEAPRKRLILEWFIEETHQVRGDVDDPGNVGMDDNRFRRKARGASLVARERGSRGGCVEAGGAEETRWSEISGRWSRGCWRGCRGEGRKG